MRARPATLSFSALTAKAARPPLKRAHRSGESIPRPAPGPQAHGEEPPAAFRLRDGLETDGGGILPRVAGGLRAAEIDVFERMLRQVLANLEDASKACAPGFILSGAKTLSRIPRLDAFVFGRADSPGDLFRD